MDQIQKESLRDVVVAIGGLILFAVVTAVL